MIKKVSKTVDDVSSLGPVLGKYFDAKSTASKAVVAAKKSKSSMGTAIQIEMALDQAKRFEDELQLLFMQSGKIDVWNKIKSRAAAMDVESAHDARREREAAEKRNKEQSDRLYQKRKELEAHLTYAAKALRGISPASFDLLVMFLTGRVKWIVTKGWNPEISEWKHGMCDEWLRLVSLFGLDDGTLTFRLSRYRDGSDNKSGDEFIPFEKYDDARDKWIELNGSTVNDYTVKTAAAHNIELPPEAVAEWMSKKTDGCRKEIESLRARIVAQETEIAKIDGAATGIGAKPKAVRRTVAKRSGAKPGPKASPCFVLDNMDEKKPGNPGFKIFICKPV